MQTALRLTRAITAPETHLEKEYEVATHAAPTAAQIVKLSSGLVLNDGPTRPCPVWLEGGGPRFRIVLTEGRNRQVHALMTCES